jgi:hypothetical protein
VVDFFIWAPEIIFLGSSRYYSKSRIKYSRKCERVQKFVSEIRPINLPLAVRFCRKKYDAGCPNKKFCHPLYK